jgi:hypothetical protein
MNKKKHYDCELADIGFSDIASLTLRSCDKVGILRFCEDDSYCAWIADDFCEIPEHYNLVFECGTWLYIYDDNGLAWKTEENYTAIKVYRSGGYGCIIQLIK